MGNDQAGLERREVSFKNNEFRPSRLTLPTLISPATAQWMTVAIEYEDRGRVEIRSRWECGARRNNWPDVEVLERQYEACTKFSRKFPKMVCNEAQQRNQPDVEEDGERQCEACAKCSRAISWTVLNGPCALKVVAVKSML